MTSYYELIKEAKPLNKAKKIRFDPLQNIFLASCHNHAGVEILGVSSGTLLILADGKTTLDGIVKSLSKKFNVSEADIQEEVIAEVRNLQRKHLLYFEV